MFQCMKQFKECCQYIWDIPTTIFIYLQLWKRNWIQNHKLSLKRWIPVIQKALSSLDSYKNSADELDDLCLAGFTSC